MKIETILVATDFSDSAMRAVDTAIDFAIKFEAEIIILNAYQAEVPLAPSMMPDSCILPSRFIAQIANEARERVETEANGIEKHGIVVTGIAVEHSAAQAIIDEAASRSADLIVMGTRGLTGIQHLALGSVADRVVRTASCPVLTVGSPGH